ncbi:hypothetical protein NUO52_002564 [Salmonella enterica]|uniref:Uncharacterized protein n=1 Tax=Salmonella enterica TaxID=28901 RepID=A0A5V5MLD3_SALER|nr:hypothetical protein [Salmonella enterica]EAW2147927.1 hypothetical protein [Salmonella enterica subsp. enterica]EBL6564648.1 hypothetical protein [Salmonella enterica subsp. enterica serovar Muenchen]EDQ9907609.1 hypothetical protein [Salmonella enterica subsp. salamae]EED9446820.1 hypothetical protein [Salmonella enterica subsp. enterica serovar Panama]EAM5393886.1 hypothetical protein [Salmonella enterica]
MSISTTKHRNEEVNVSLSDRRKAEIRAPRFDLFGETYTFVETFSGTVINSDPGNGQIWVKTNAGDEKQISDYGISFRSSHTIHKYELRQYSEDGSYDAYKDALIVNEKTGEHEVNLKRKTIVIPAFLTMLFHNASTTSFFRAMPVPKWFYILFTLLCMASFIAFCSLLVGFKDGYVWDEHKYMWFTYFLSRIGSFVCIKWIKRRSERFNHELRNIIDLVKS